MPKPSQPELPKTQIKPNPAMERRTRRVHSLEYKISIVAQADACARGELGELLRREGLYSSQVNQWRKELSDGSTEKLSKSAPGPKPKLTPEQREIEALRKQVNRLQHELHVSNSCIELQKKAFQLLDLNQSENKP